MATNKDVELIEILLVEPNPGDSRLFSEQFTDGKILNTVHAVTDGEAALDFVHQRGEYDDAPQPDLIILEPHLPGLDGMEVLSTLNNDPEIREIPVVVLTSSDLGEEIVKSHGLDADAYIRKPVEPDEFVAFVRSVEDFWLSVVRETSAK